MTLPIPPSPGNNIVQLHILKSMQVVIDTSAIMAILLEEPERSALIAATDGATLLAPAVLPWEVGNALVTIIRRRRLSEADARLAWHAYEAIPSRLVDVDVGEAISLATRYGLYAYDAYFLALAKLRSLRLLTLDQRLGVAARRAGVDLVEVRG
jgi:predicted nucleic acid-binding protein